MTDQLKYEASVLAEFCKAAHIRKLSFFGSVLRDDFSDASDVDILVEFEQGQEPGLIGFAGMQIELSEIFGREVDLRTPEDLSPYFRDKVVRSAYTAYAA
jgi:predicted nucleotidyltransferase